MSIYNQCQSASRHVELNWVPNTSKYMRTIFVVILMLIAAAPIHGALPELEQLVPDNFHRLEQIGMIRRGIFEEIAWSPDDLRVAGVGSAGARLYDLDSGREIVLNGHQGGVNDVDFSPDGHELVTAGDDGTLRIWDSHSGQILRILNPYADRECACVYRLTASKYTADGIHLWVGADNGPLRVIESRTGYKVNEDPRTVLEINPDSARTRFAVSEPRSPQVTIWHSSAAFAPVRVLDLRFTVWNIAFVPNSTYLLAAGFVGAELALVDVVTSETVNMVRGARVLHAGNAGSIVTQVIDWSSDVRRISLRITDAESGALQFNAPIPVELTDVRFSPSGDRVAASDSSGGFTVWDWRKNLTLLNLAPQGTALIGLALLDNGMIASIDSMVGIPQSLTRLRADSGSIVRLWDLSTGRELGAIHSIDFGLATVDTLYWDGRIDRLIVASTANPAVQLEHDPVTGEIRTVDSYNVQRLADNQYVDESPDGLLRAEAQSNDDVRISEAADDLNALVLRGAGPAVRFSSSGALLLTAGPSGVIRIWGVRSEAPAPD